MATAKYQRNRATTNVHNVDRLATNTPVRLPAAFGLRMDFQLSIGARTGKARNFAKPTKNLATTPGTFGSQLFAFTSASTNHFVAFTSGVPTTK